MMADKMEVSEAEGEGEGGESGQNLSSEGLREENQDFMESDQDQSMRNKRKIVLSR